MTIHDPNTSLLTSSKGTTPDKTPAPLAGRANYVSFAVNNVPPPVELYIGVDDALVIQGATTQVSEVITVNVRLLLPNGRIEDNQFTINPPSTRAVLRKAFTLAEGFLLSASASAGNATTRGQTFCRIYLQRGASGTGQPGQVLFSDYVTQFLAPAYPFGPQRSPSEGTGNLINVGVGNPGAGADWIKPLPVNTRWRIQSIFALLTASAAVANRQVSIILQNSAASMWQAVSIANQTASQATAYSFGAITPYVPSNPLIQVIPIPPGFILGNISGLSAQILTSTLNIQAADQWTQMALYVEEWLDNV